MRSFSTDRPTKSYSPYTVDAGHWQYETDIVNWTYDRYNESDVTTSNWLLANSVFKLGLTQHSDVEVGLSPVVINHTHDRAAQTKNTNSGFGDVYTRIKYNLLGNDSGNYALAAVPYVKIPTASRDIGNRHWEGGIYAPFVAVLPQNWTLTLLTEYDQLENAALDGTHANYQNLVNVSHPIVKDVTGYAELWSGVNTDRDADDQYSADFAVAWLVHDNLQLDAGVNVGLNKATPDAQSYIGISQRF